MIKLARVILLNQIYEDNFAQDQAYCTKLASKEGKK